jgi:hypothetical protein
MLRACPREKEVKELVERGQWPQACAPELRAHVGGCRCCSELALVTAAFQRARAESAGAANIGSPGVLWWRAQLRRRNAAVERIGRPILGAQIFALAVNLVLAVAFVVWQARHGLAWLTWPSWNAWFAQLPLTATLHLDSGWLDSLFGSGWSPFVMIPALATLALLGGVVVFLASERQ